MFKTLDDLNPEQRVLVRLDLNSPVEDDEVQDNRRFDRHAETVRELADAGHRVVLMAHQGRPGGDDFVSLEQHAAILAKHVDHDVQFVADTYGDEAIDAIESLSAGEVLLLENTRMCDEELPEEDPEVKADTEFVQTLAPYFDAYINDAYSAAHRSHASLVGFALELPAYAGRVMQTEYEANSSIATREFDGQVTMVVGGTKATDVINVMNNLGDKVDQFLLGGIAGELFLRAAGHEVGFDLDGMDFFDDQWEANRDTIESLLDERGDQIKLAVDLAYEDDNDERAEIAVSDIDEKDRAYLDVGSETVETYDPIIRDSEAVFVKGALGLFEDERFSVGTVGVLRAISETDCFSVVGGGDTSRAIEMYGMDEADFGHVSIAGGAYIRALTGAPLAGVEVLK
ncbi:phosphoglycerate kinase [Haloferax mediterranei ATCC 33500]|uniref:Phosphoglycerate kinase n=1 Tax=Haloferax mediterranei (strain ATCC 33500 / DSM 1411 / JCM 8866 / NBRC 14739 / NCIMB 2177 / R-4) TaxID=523841 RepID=I3R1S1_HALMT|nr:phosphoglycerate kinase [Haloferax mediterranei]AFK18181.1 phosphoglycerate kinase [Haloferax mediterranei ATCC 33500]AHZ22411.1 phosphoglycerate kinase [Haloferax mediterranei ATCC 33500]EMA02545.1 phosphoglycerate kinase [Haloferax mediterranei ATCC 33500]MDX5988272.1 phosphoglycerate kinase [Haloferax mediterranei ATCC 33500]QCQ74710.1 phosphoglycerate kinase [Haloferax mediterranei ATCC 33500]